MKKFLLVCCMMAVAMTASAQFTEFRSIYTTPQPSYTPSPGYGVPFSTYESLQSHQQTKPRMQEVTLKGYYKKGNDWYYTPIRVGVIGDSSSPSTSAKPCATASSKCITITSKMMANNLED